MTTGKTVARSCAMQTIRRASRSITALYEQALAPVGLTASQFSILVALADQGSDGVMLGKLAASLGMDRTTVTRALVPLERDDLVMTRTSRTDARRRVLVLGPKGKATLDDAIPLWEDAQKQALARLGASRWKQAASTLSRLEA